MALIGLGGVVPDAYAKPGGGPPGQGGGPPGQGGGPGGGSGQSIGTCSLSDVYVFSQTFGATDCENQQGNDDTNNFTAFDTNWTFYGKYEVDEGVSEGNTVTISDLNLEEGEVKGGTWSIEDDLLDLAESAVVVLKAGNYYASYEFDFSDSQFTSLPEATGGGFTLDGVTEGGKAALSHLSIYYRPRTEEPDPPTVPEPTSALALLAAVGLGSRLKQRFHTV